jgi:hypothetical protein
LVEGVHHHESDAVSITISRMRRRRLGLWSSVFPDNLRAARRLLGMKVMELILVYFLMFYVVFFDGLKGLNSKL